MITVIVPTRNRAHLLAAALRSISGQTLSQDLYEILVIDNGSSDDTAAVVRDSTLLNSNVKYFYEAQPGLHVGRHRGMLEAAGDVLVFADDDIEALPEWLATISELFSDPEVAMVGGNNIPLFLEPPPQWLKQLWERPHPLGGKVLPPLSIIELQGAARHLSPQYVWGCNFSIRKDVLTKAGGFHPDGMPSELIHFRGDGETHVSRFVAKSGLKCLFHPEASVYHKVTPERMSIEYFYKRGFNQGVSDSYTQFRVLDGRNLFRRALSGRLYVLARRVLRTLRARWSLKGEALRAEEALHRGHYQGFLYHRAAYKTKPEVRDWVHKASYF